MGTYESVCTLPVFPGILNVAPPLAVSISGLDLVACHSLC